MHDVGSHDFKVFWNFGTQDPRRPGTLINMQCPMSPILQDVKVFGVNVNTFRIFCYVYT